MKLCALYFSDCPHGSAKWDQHGSYISGRRRVSVLAAPVRLPTGHHTQLSKYRTFGAASGSLCKHVCWSLPSSFVLVKRACFQYFLCLAPIMVLPICHFAPVLTMRCSPAHNTDNTWRFRARSLPLTSTLADAYSALAAGLPCHPSPAMTMHPHFLGVGSLLPTRSSCLLSTGAHMPLDRTMIQSSAANLLQHLLYLPVLALPSGFLRATCVLCAEAKWSSVHAGEAAKPAEQSRALYRNRCSEFQHSNRSCFQLLWVLPEAPVEPCKTSNTGSEPEPEPPVTA